MYSTFYEFTSHMLILLHNNKDIPRHDAPNPKLMFEHELTPHCLLYMGLMNPASASRFSQQAEHGRTWHADDCCLLTPLVRPKDTECKLDGLVD